MPEPNTKLVCSELNELLIRDPNGMLVDIAIIGVMSIRRISSTVYGTCSAHFTKHLGGIATGVLV